MKRWTWALTISGALALGLAACDSRSEPAADSRVTTLPYFNDATFTPHWLTPDAPELDTFHRIPPFRLIDQDSQVVTEKTFRGKIYVADFFFTSCPGICPRMTDNMGILQAAFLDDDDVLLLSHSVTPTRDSVPVLKAYAESHDVVSGKWHLVTGERAQIYRLGRQAYFVEEDLGLEKDPDEFLHTENFVLVDRRGYIRGIYNGLNKTSIDQLVADIRTLEQEQ
ncbi:MAG: SCO family protein [Bacteroidetes bacterium]|nr:MAG: SCO family protein [Bacteroidota bacterium]